MPFDPRRARGAEPGETLFAGSGRDQPAAIISVSELTRRIKGAITRALPGTLHVVGELSNVARPPGGHVYFTLKDASSEVRCVLWRSSAAELRFEMTDGLEVIATGSVDVYEPRGQYQFYVRRLEPRGMGALELAFRQLKEKLGKEGLFDPSRKRSLPRFPRRIAVVTSLSGAAIRDILQAIQRRYPCLHVLVFDVRVQGEGAAEEIADAIRRINHSGEALGGIDAMIVGRGGGSLEDLWAFNEEIVARAIHASRIPIISAVGHEVDFTIADFVADVRAATPTAAAELVAPVLSELLIELETHARRLTLDVARLLQASRGRLAAIERCEWFRDPLARVRHRQQQVDEVAGRLKLAAASMAARLRAGLHAWEVRLFRCRPEAVLARRRERLSSIEHRLRWAQGHLNLLLERRLNETERRLAAASPIRLIERQAVLVEQLEARLRASGHEPILRRGFSITRKARGGRIVRDPKEVRDGDRLETQTAGGIVTSRVVDAGQGELFDQPGCE